jgi:hypothetical protein
MRRLCALIEIAASTLQGGLRVRWPNDRRPGSSQPTADEVV